MKKIILAIVFLLLICLASCSTSQNKASQLETINSTISFYEYVLDSSMLYADISYNVDRRWDYQGSKSNGDEYHIQDKNIILHIWYEIPLRDQSADEILSKERNNENLVFTDEYFDFFGNNARHIEEYSALSFKNGETYEYYDGSYSIIRNNKVLHLTIVGNKSDQETCQNIIDDVFDSIIVRQ